MKGIVTMKKQLLALLSLFSFSFICAMQPRVVPGNFAEHLNKLQKESDLQLVSIYKRIIPLLTPSDLSTITQLLDNTGFPAHRNFSKHVLFIKYVIDILSKHKPDYTDEALVMRFQKYIKLIVHPSPGAEEKALLQVIRKLDWLLKDIIPLPQNLRDLARNCFTGLGATLTAVIRYVPELSQLAKRARREDLSFYLQTKMCSEISPFHKKLLLEPLVTLLNSCTQDQYESQALIESKAATLGNFLEELEKKSGNRSIQYQWGMYGPDGYLSETASDVDTTLAEILDHLPLHSLRHLFFLFVNPYIHPRPVCYVLLLKALAREDFQEGIFPTEEVALLKDTLMKTISYSDSSKCHSDDVQIIKEFLKEFNKYFIKSLKESLQDKLSPAKKKLLLKAGQAMFAWLESGQFEQTFPLQGKSDNAASPVVKRRASELGSALAASCYESSKVPVQPKEGTVGRRNSVREFLDKEMEIEVSLEEPIQSGSQKKRARFADDLNLNHVLPFDYKAPVASLLPKGNKEQEVRSDQKEAGAEQYQEEIKDLTLRLQQALEHQEALKTQLQAEQEQHEEVILSYKAQLEGAMKERDKYKTIVDQMRKPIDYSTTPKFL